MKLHIITVGEPKLAYAKLGWQEYLTRLKHFHQVRVSHIADKNNDANHLLAAAKGTSLIALDGSHGRQFSSHSLSAFLDQQALSGQEISFMIGGPEGLPDALITAAQSVWSFSELTFPHDLAMVILLESLYRASTISAGRPYHK